MDTITIRPFTQHDYPAVAALGNAVYPDYPFSESEWRHFDTLYDGERLKMGRIVAERPDGRMLGWAQYNHWSDTYHPRKLAVEGMVHPESQGRGVGGRLYDAVMDMMASLDPIVLWARIRETFESGIRFMEKRGFREVRRAWESRLDVAAFDPTPFTEKAARPLQELQITTVAEERRTDPDWLGKAYDLHLEAVADAPRPDVFTPPSLEEYVKSHDENPDYLPEAHFLVRDGDRYLAESNMFRSEQLPDVLYQGFTGTRRASRNRGLALALKLRTVAYARVHGVREIRTWNDTLNEPMLHINVKMGFVRQPAWITFEKRLHEESRDTAST